MKTTLMMGGLAAALLLSANTAGATTYTSDEGINGATADIAITTDGVIGVLSQNDITAYNIDITDPSGSVDLTNLNSGLDVLGSALSATASALQFNFGASGYNWILVELGGTGSSGPLYCAATKGCYPGGTSPGIGVTTQQGESPLEQIGETGVVTLASVASVSAAPEPSTWMLMLAGVGTLGLMLRRARKTAGDRNVFA